MNPLNSLVVRFQIEPDYPIMQAVVQYRISRLETEILFPAGESKTFPNWDVKGVRETFFTEEILPDTDVEDSQKTNFGIQPSDIMRFVADLTHKTQYDFLFPSDFVQIVEDNPEPEPEPPMPIPPVAVLPPRKVVAPWFRPKSDTKSEVRKFPYLEVAKLWESGMKLKKIAETIGYKNDRKDCTHTLRIFLTKMHKGYIDAEGNKVKLPMRDRTKATNA